MKKVMFLIVGLLFSASASAATLQFDGGTADSSSIFATESVTGSEQEQTVVFDFTVADEAVEVNSTVVEFFDSSFDVASVTLTGTNIVAAGIDYVNIGTGTWALLPSVLLDIGSYSITAIFTSTGGILSANVSAVPIPAALWLFAPALIGFFGFRRKAAVVA